MNHTTLSRNVCEAQRGERREAIVLPHPLEKAKQALKALALRIHSLIARFLRWLFPSLVPASPPAFRAAALPLQEAIRAPASIALHGSYTLETDLWTFFFVALNGLCRLGKEISGSRSLTREGSFLDSIFQEALFCKEQFDKAHLKEPNEAVPLFFSGLKPLGKAAFDVTSVRHLELFRHMRRLHEEILRSAPARRGWVLEGGGKVYFLLADSAGKETYYLGALSAGKPMTLRVMPQMKQVFQTLRKECPYVPAARGGENRFNCLTFSFINLS